MLRFARLVSLLALPWIGACSVPAPHEPAERPATTDPRPPWGTIRGTVVDQAGTPIPNAHAVALPHGHEAVTAADGTFEIPRLDPGSYDVVVAAAGFGSERTLAVSVVALQATEADVVLPAVEDRTGELTIRVLDAAGDPLADATVALDDGTERTTDTLGVALFAGLQGQTVDVRASEATGRMRDRTLRGLELPALGGLQATVQLPGAPPPEATYVGSSWCGLCHPDQSDAWQQTRHARALATTVPDALLPLFAAGSSVDLPDGLVTLGLAGAQPTLTVDGDAGDSRTWNVTGLIGDPDIAGVFLTELGDQAYALPTGWTAGDPDRPGWPDTQARLTAYDAGTWLDGSGAFTFSAGDRPDPSLSADTRCLACHATGFSLSQRGDGGVDLSATVGTGRWIEPGVGCERCHGPGSTHMGSSIPDKPFNITRPDRLDPARGNEVCTQCHSRTEGVGTGLPYPHASGGPFVPGDVLADFASPVPELWPNGSARASRSQGDEIGAGLHGTGGLYQLACFDCHDPHGHAVADDGAPLAHDLKQDSRDNSLCLSCHDALSFSDGTSPADHAAHGVYDPANPLMEGRCVGCHMPATASALVWHETGGGGDLASHRFAASPPQDALDVFDTAGASVLPVGEFPAHACLECHAWGKWYREQSGDTLFAPTGDPKRRTTHSALQTAFEGKFP